MPGTGGLPARRVDQQRSPAPPTAAPGGAAGIIRAREVIVIGANGGVFVYSAAGALVASLAGVTGTDPVDGGTVVAGVAAYPVVSGDTYAVELANFTDPFGTSVAALTLADLNSPPSSPAAVTALSAASGSELILESGQGLGAGGSSIALTDSIVSGISGGAVTVTAGRFTVPGIGSINGVFPGPFTITGPGAAAGNPPSGAGTASASTVAGSLLSYFDALAATYNTSVTALGNLTNGLVSWSV